eukprot:14221689-Alexandrium_andersonii.AAC.1
MSASLVGSEMCIRDRPTPGAWSAFAGGGAWQARDPFPDPWAGASWGQSWSDPLHLSLIHI